MDKKNITFNLRYAEINVSKYSQFDLEKKFNKDEKPLIEFQSNFQFRVEKEEDKLVCIVNVKLIVLETKEHFAELKVENSFNIKPFEEVVKIEDDDTYDIPDPVLHNIVSLSISTVRGILSEKLKGTIAQNEVYPLINAASLFQDKK
ncbi:hypothetical protein [Ulvibacter litoralis]|uniref:Preprotein translocase subunit SecB n=1 Tax=Ulvibacter litoralis TaxID=227084 RepID=A0A1G7JR15_9FLAO|nr:hypothetical protein [Ulvibacter litoralis]GHC65836.1 hypothetical protein GCM10008083_33740 [Ulvibacter litoralis]SDF27390.1 hypothetical protein SAMN05421855_1253 [Ulvibacter litoralis]